MSWIGAQHTIIENEHGQVSLKCVKSHKIDEMFYVFHGISEMQLGSIPKFLFLHAIGILWFSHEKISKSYEIYFPYPTGSFLMQQNLMEEIDTFTINLIGFSIHLIPVRGNPIIILPGNRQTHFQGFSLNPWRCTQPFSSFLCCAFLRLLFVFLDLVVVGFLLILLWIWQSKSANITLIYYVVYCEMKILFSNLVFSKFL